MKIAIYGYGNLGRGVELAAKQNSDMELVGVFTRRDPETVKTVFSDTNVYKIDDFELVMPIATTLEDEIDEHPKKDKNTNE